MPPVSSLETLANFTSESETLSSEVSLTGRVSSRRRARPDHSMVVENLYATSVDEAQDRIEFGQHSPECSRLSATASPGGPIGSMVNSNLSRATVGSTSSVQSNHPIDNVTAHSPSKLCPAVSTDDDLTPRSTGTHGTTYRMAVSDLVKTICGDCSQLEVDEVLLGIYFAWQAPQHMPVDEGLFRRESSPGHSLYEMHSLMPYQAI